jgi:alpha-glucosidase
MALFPVVVVAWFAAAAASGNFSTRFTSGGKAGTLTLSLGSRTSFLLSVRFDGWEAAPLSSPSLIADRPVAPSEPVSWGSMSGLRTAFGALLAATDGSGAWALFDSENSTLVASAGPPAQALNGAGYAGVLLPVNGAGVESGPLQTDNCLNNGDFGPPFFWNKVGGYMSFPVSSWLYDPTRPHCYPVSFQGPPLSPWSPDSTKFTVGKRAAQPERTQSYPGGLNVGSKSECSSFCNQDESCVAVDYSDAAQDLTLEANCFILRNYSGTMDAPGWSFSTAAPPPTAPALRSRGWWVLGASAADFYLAPSLGPLPYLKALYQLTGAPGIPPRYAFGAMYTYWGYETMEEVEGNMTLFRDGQYPIDAHIMDYDWWDADGTYNDTGPVDYDFAYDPVMFGPHRFIHSADSTIPNVTTTGAVDLFEHFHNDLHIKFGGIRKPRTYSHRHLSNGSGWLLPSSFEVGAGPNNWNMTPGNGWSEWWVPHSAHFLKDGLDFWWNDEGETQWFTYTWWNDAQRQLSSQIRPGERFFSVNRAFQPGMQRYSASTWTGDDQDCSHQKVLGYAASGQLYHECDMTSPSATVLVRQYQNAILSPVFRVHQMHGIPRFPFLWGTTEHAAAMRSALNLRYALIPHLYSLAHSSSRNLLPLAAPASWFFSGAGPLESTYLYGGTLLPTEVSVVRVEGVAHPDENTTTVWLPAGTGWFPFNSTALETGGQRITRTQVPLGEFVFFVKEGSLLALQGGSSPIQHTGEIGGELSLHIYSGGDAEFTLFEDDGVSTAYEKARGTTFTWSESGRTLTWTVESHGFPGGINDYTTLLVTLFEAHTPTPLVKGGLRLGRPGSVAFSASAL